MWNPVDLNFDLSDEAPVTGEQASFEDHVRQSGDVVAYGGTLPNPILWCVLHYYASCRLVLSYVLSTTSTRRRSSFQR